jgi:hypothetical protein
MDVTYRLTPDDLSNYRYIVRDRLQKMAGPSSFGSTIQRAFAAFAAAVLVTFGVLFFAGDHALVPYIVGILFGAGLVLAMFWLTYYDQEKKLVDRDGPTLADHTIAVNASGLNVSAPHLTAHYVWKAFRDVTRERGLIVLWLEPSLGVVIPERAFSSVGTLEEFLSAVEARRTASVLPRAGSFA